MSVSRPCYASREDVQRALDFKDNLLSNNQIDRAIQSASDLIDGHFKRVFYPYDATKYLDWPAYQYAYPWKYWLDQHDLLVLTSLQSPAGTTIPLSNVFLEPVNNAGLIPAKPYTRIELDRSTTAAWGPGAAAGHLPVRAHRADRGLPRRALVGTGLLASPLRPADSAVRTRTAGALRMLTRADHPSVAPGGGQVVPGHDAGVRRFALDHRQPGKTPVPAPV